MRDVVVVGGGVIGLSVAWELAGEGVAVTVLEKGEFGREASWAGAGILPPGNPDKATEPASRLRAHSCVLWPELSEQLRERTGIDNGYGNCGGLELRINSPVDDLTGEIRCWREEGVAVEEASPEQLREIEPKLNPEVTGGFRLPGLSQVRNPRHLKALVAGCAARGIELRPGTPVTGFERRNGKIAAVETPAERFPAGQVCIAGGAWSRQVLAGLGIELAVTPVRGQIVLLSMQPLPFRHVLQCGARYLVPRPDGRILIGSTEEHAGFEKKNTAAAVAELIEFGRLLVPALAEAKFEQCWSGLRPGSADGLPYLGTVPGTENLTIAAGHFRGGLQQSPVTGVLMRQVILGQKPLFPLEAFSCERFGERGA